MDSWVLLYRREISVITLCILFLLRANIFYEKRRYNVRTLGSKYFVFLLSIISLTKEPWKPCLYCKQIHYSLKSKRFSFNLFVLNFIRNYNYGEAGETLKVDLLNHPEYLEQNATLAFQAAIWRWMTPVKEHQPSAHDVFVGNWKPTESDTLAKRVPGFGTTMNVLYGDVVCGQGHENEAMNNMISHYLYYLSRLGVAREEAGPHEVLSCAEQVAFNPSSSSSPWPLFGADI